MRTHYDVLGIDRSADADAVRAAYRRRARAVHPDAGYAAGTDGSHERDAAAEMAALNEAYRVLRDPARRVVYDRSLTNGGGSSSSAAGSSVPPTPTTVSFDPDRYRPVTPARVPWRGMLAVAAVGIAVVLVGAAFVDPGTPPGPDGILGPGSCVAIEDNGDAVEVACGGADDRLVVALVAFDERCPAGTLAHRDRQGLGLACVAPMAGG